MISFAPAWRTVLRRQSVAQKKKKRKRGVVSPVFRKGLYEDGVSRCEIDDFGIGEGRKGILAQKVEDGSEGEGPSQVVEVTHVWAFRLKTLMISFFVETGKRHSIW
jgi:hypothetical protein